MGAGPLLVGNQNLGGEFICTRVHTWIRSRVALFKVCSVSSNLASSSRAFARKSVTPTQLRTTPLDHTVGLGYFSLCMSRADRSKQRRALTPCLDPDRLGLTQSRQAVAWTIDPVDNKTKVLVWVATSRC